AGVLVHPRFGLLTDQVDQHITFIETEKYSREAVGTVTGVAQAGPLHRIASAPLLEERCDPTEMRQQRSARVLDAVGTSFDQQVDHRVIGVGTLHDPSSVAAAVGADSQDDGGPRACQGWRS